ncbi:MAG: hypothetical protein NVSMB64_26400 [Candidatus Velthaea sp.]
MGLRAKHHETPRANRALDPKNDTAWYNRQSGFVRFKAGIQRLLERLAPSGTQWAIILAVLEGTQGAKGQPDWFAYSFDQWAERLYLSRRAARAAIEELVDWGVVLTRVSPDDKRIIEYRLHLSAWEKLPTHDEFLGLVAARKPVASEVSNDTIPKVEPPVVKPRIVPAGRESKPVPFPIERLRGIKWKNDLSHAALFTPAIDRAADGDWLVIECTETPKRSPREAKNSCVQDALIFDLSRSESTKRPQKSPQKLRSPFVRPFAPSTALAVPDQLSPLEQTFEWCYAQWGKRRADKGNARRLFLAAFADASDAVRKRFSAGFEAHAAAHAANGWHYCPMTFAEFLEQELWRVPAPTAAKPKITKTDAHLQAWVDKENKKRADQNKS